MTVNASSQAWLAAWRAQREARPDLEVPYERFAAHLLTLERDAGAPLPLAELCLPDLYLVCGCLAGDAAAVAAFEREVAPVLARAVASFGAEAQREVTQRLMAALLVDHRGRGPLLVEYGGKGALRRWLRVVAVREATRLYHAQRREAPPDDDALFASLAGEGDLAAELVRMEAATRFRRAFVAALAELGARERTALRMSIVDGLSIDELAPLFAVHRATAARWLAAAREAVLAGTRKHLMKDLGLGASEAESLMRAARSRLELSLERVLAQPAAEPSDDS